jgi:dihydroorotate dehydrogenase
MTSLYHLLKPLLFRMDAERAHYLTMDSFRLLCSLPPLRTWFRRTIGGADTGLEREVFGLRFRNPIGLAAGFDKDARYIREMATLGFGFIEIGTLTPRPQDGNPRPRLFRLPADRALINRMGFNNEGVEAAARRLEALDRPTGLIIGGNIGKNKDTPNDRAVEDYLTCLHRLAPLVDYFVVNISSPNTPGLRELQDRDPLRALLLRVQEANQANKTPRPLLLKIAPDLTHPQVDDIIQIASETHLAGLVVNNTTIERAPLASAANRVLQIGAGGLSGAPLRERSDQLMRYISEHTGNTLALVGVGGIDSPRSAMARFERGADLVQIYSGLVYAGPGLVKEIKRAMRAHL